MGLSRFRRAGVCTSQVLSAGLLLPALIQMPGILMALLLLSSCSIAAKLCHWTLQVAMLKQGGKVRLFLQCLWERPLSQPQQEESWRTWMWTSPVICPPPQHSSLSR